MRIKKRGQQIAIRICILLSLCTIAYAQSDFFYDIGQPDTSTIPTTDLGNESSNLLTADNSILKKLLTRFGLENFSSTGSPAISYVQYIINIVLGLAAFIATILLIYGFYLMFFSKQEDGRSRARKIFIGVLLALLIMGFAAIIVRFFFYLYTLLQ